MSIKSKRELTVTREKLAGLEKLLQGTQAKAAIPTLAQERTVQSLRKAIIQMKEEIARFEAKAFSTAK
ncbi:MAG: hypothetical protein EXS16_21635 [Gemmataceae bacterium]|nr:hypothetical protein [Gemmataceae bacterium]